MLNAEGGSHDQLAEEPGKLCYWERVVGGLRMTCSESDAVVRCVRAARASQ